MSDTPRTDALLARMDEKKYDDRTGSMALIAHAHELEQELAEARGVISEGKREYELLESMDNAAMDKMQAMIKEQSERIKALADYAEKARRLLESVEREWPEVKGENSGLLWQIRSLLGMNPDPDTGAVLQSGKKPLLGSPTPRTDALEVKMYAEGLEHSFRLDYIFGAMRQVEVEAETLREMQRPQVRTRDTDELAAKLRGIADDYSAGTEADAVLNEAADVLAARFTVEEVAAVLRIHWLTEMRCDHPTGTDRSFCWCGSFQSTPQPSVGDALSRWIEHVMEQLPLHREALRTVAGKKS